MQIMHIKHAQVATLASMVSGAMLRSGQSPRKGADLPAENRWKLPRILS